jgi:disulfide bond formation protein DsbB
VALAIAALAFLYGMGLGIQQAGAEWGFWEGPRDCATGGAGAPTSVSGLIDQINKTRIVSCTEVQWRFLGLSFAGWNALISAGVAGILAVVSVGRRPG